MDIHWHEDVHKWHPGQQWIWEPGGFGVFDPGINAFSIATKIFPGGLFVQSAELSVPRECADADRGRHHLLQPGGRRAAARQPRLAAQPRARNGRSPSRPRDGTDGPPRRRRRDADPRTASAQADDGTGEYPDIYRTFVDLIDERRSLVDVAPFRLVADCLLVGRRTSVEAVTVDGATRLTRIDRNRPACVTTSCGRGNEQVADVTTDELIRADEAFAGNRLLSTFSREARGADRAVRRRWSSSTPARRRAQPRRPGRAPACSRSGRP